MHEEPETGLAPNDLCNWLGRCCLPSIRGNARWELESSQLTKSHNRHRDVDLAHSRDWKNCGNISRKHYEPSRTKIDAIGRDPQTQGIPVPGSRDLLPGTACVSKGRGRIRLGRSG